MSVFSKLRAEFPANWTSILVGWTGLGVLSPWPDRWIEVPPLLSPDEVAAYAAERLESTSDDTEQDVIVDLLSLDLRSENRETIRGCLTRLSDLDAGDPAVELRKWRLVLLEELMEKLSPNPLYGLTALSEFWQNFGFPPDSPHEVQGRGNTITAHDYYNQANMHRLLELHQAWIQQEKAAIKHKTQFS